MKMNLVNLLNEYTDNLCDRTFIIKYKNNKELKIKFYRENMCHLMGLQHIYGNDKHYLGSSGYNKILNEKIKIDSLKLHNRKGYNYIKSRIDNFSEIRNVILYGNMIKFYKGKVKNKGTLINADFVMYKDDIKFICHLFLVKEFNCDVYVPVSFIPLSKKDNDCKKYTDFQEHKIVTECIEISD